MTVASTTTPARFLPGMSQMLAEVGAQGSKISTTDFVACIDHLMPVFDFLGPVFHIAKNEFNHKRDSILASSSKYNTLDQLVNADKAAKRVTTKNSGARNLHRLMTTITFIRLLLERLSQSPSITLREATHEAYEASMAACHTIMIRAAVRTGMLALPSREQFLRDIGETELSAKEHAREFIAAATTTVGELEKLYDGPMPVSDVWFWPSHSS